MKFKEGGGGGEWMKEKKMKFTYNFRNFIARFKFIGRTFKKSFFFLKNLFRQNKSMPRN